MKKDKENLDQPIMPSSHEDRAKMFRNILNKKSGEKVSYDLSEENPSEVKKWISTGSYILDRTICKGKVAGIPMGKFCEIAGLESTGKSYIACQIAANALREGIDVVYFDSEASIDPEFVNKIFSKYGLSIKDILYVQATSVEFVMETIEELLSQSEKPFLFILDSLANTPTKSSLENDFNPLGNIAEKARILGLAFQKLTLPISNHQSTLLIVNQLKTKISKNPFDALIEPFSTPGGKAAIYAFSLRLWLTQRKNKDSFILNEEGIKIGSEISCLIRKSRFGSEGRKCNTKILWGGDNVSFQEEEFWLDVIKSSDSIAQAGAWTTMKYEDGTEEKFTGKSFIEKLNESEQFKNRVLKLIDEVLLK